MSISSLGPASVRAVLCSALLCLALVGCGGKSGASSPTTTSASTSAGTHSTNQQFIAQADGACARVNAEIVAIKASGATRAEVLRVVPRTLAVERNGNAKLQALDPPSSLTREWQLMLGERRTLTAELTQLLEIAKKNDGTSVKSLLASKKRAHAALSKLAKQAGFTDCAKIGRVG